MLCTTNLMTTYKNLPIFFSLGGRLEEKNRSQNLCATNLLTSRKNDEDLHIIFHTNFLNLLFNLFLIILCDLHFMYHEFDDNLQKSTLIFCTRWSA